MYIYNYEAIVTIFMHNNQDVVLWLKYSSFVKKGLE